MFPLSTVLNIAKLVLLLGVGFLYFVGLGALVMELLFPKDKKSSHENIQLLDIIPMTIVLGIIVNYGISLVFQSLPVVLILGFVMALIGVWRLVSRYFHATISTRNDNNSLNQWIGVLFISIILLSPILIPPLSAWDARHIWFFHAKMIYTAGSFGPLAGWQDPAVDFSHVDYPELVPGIAAQVAYILSYWNEFIPKVALVFILVPALLWVFTFAQKSFAFLILILIFPFGIGVLIWEGLMDGYLAMYVSIAMLLLGRYIQRVRIIDFISCLTCLILVIYLKNEGLLALLAGLFAITITIFLVNKVDRMELKEYLLRWRILFAGIIIFLPLIVWSVYKKNLGLVSYLDIGSAASFARIIERINNNSYRLIIEYTFQFIEGALLLLGFLYFIASARRQPIPRTILPSLLIATVYLIGMLTVYMLTPIDVDWQLRTSANRTMLTVAGCIFVASYFILDSLENGMQTDPVKMGA